MYTTLLPLGKLPPSSSEVRDALEEAEAIGPGAILAITVPKELARESEPSGVAETSEGLNPNAPQKTTESASDAQAPQPRSQLFLLSPFRLFPLVRAPRISRSLLLSFLRKEPRLSQRNRPPRLAPILFLFRWCYCCFFFYHYHFFLTLGFVVMKFY